MKAEVVQEIVGDIRAEFDQLQVLPRLDKLISALDNQSSSPTPENQVAVKDSKEELIEEFRKSKFIRYPLYLQLTLDEMALDGYLPDGYADQIEAAFEGDELTPATVLVKVREIREKAERTSRHTDEFLEAAGFFEIESDQPTTDEQYEFSVAIPREAVENELDNFGRELVKIDKILGVFSEISTGSRADYKIKSISSSDLTIVLCAPPAAAFLIVSTLERLTVIYERILNILKLHKDLKQAKVPDAMVRDMEKFIAKTLKQEIQAAAKQLEGKLLQKIEASRRNELRTELKNALDQLAARFDRGYVFDVRGPDPVANASEGEDATEVKPNTPAWIRKMVAEKRELLRYFKVDDKPILGLPNPANDDPTGQ